MWPRFDSQILCCALVEFVVFLLCIERFFSRYSGFFLSHLILFVLIVDFSLQFPPISATALED